MARNEWQALCAAVEAYVDHPSGSQAILTAAHDYGQALLGTVLPQPARPVEEVPQPATWWVPEGTTVEEGEVTTLLEVTDPQGNPRPDDWLG